MKTNCSCSEHFSCKKLKPIHDSPILFVVSQWQVNKKEPGVLYLIYRTAVAAFFLTTWGMSFSTPSWSIYLTNWGYTLATGQSFLGFLLSFTTVLSNAFEANKVHDIFLKLYPLYWIMHQTAVSIGFMITIIFWSLLYIDMPFTALNFFVHGSNSILLFLDLWVIAHPIHLLHFVYVFTFGIIYAIFSVIYYFIDVNRGGNGYIYYILDWHYPFQTILVLLGVILLVLVLHVMSFGIHQLKILIHSKICSPSHTQSTEKLTV